MLRICSKKAIRSKALTIRLFDGSTWANLGNGQFINQETKKELPDYKIYPQIKTAFLLAVLSLLNEGTQNKTYSTWNDQ